MLKSVNLQVLAGEAIVVCGASGTGKSTLLRCLNGLELPDSGCVNFRQTPVAFKRPAMGALRQSIGMVFQSFNL
ncbi:ATP-binding cassette domain-containing protein [Bosea eneae]|uniref:ATP-binding cassette domain-containing protein n=1 Tax=Bosea eneae TaxID=151454 RepID=UPI00366CF4D4